MEKKKKWETPKLICLYRGRPEEAVLQVCKTADLPEDGPNSNCSTGTQCDTAAVT